MKFLFVVPSLKSTSPICWLVALIAHLPSKDNITVYCLDDIGCGKELKVKLTGMGVEIIYGKGSGLIGLVRNIFCGKLHRLKTIQPL